MTIKECRRYLRKWRQTETSLNRLKTEKRVIEETIQALYELTLIPSDGQPHGNQVTHPTEDKALRNCADELGSICYGCAYHDIVHCEKHLKRDAADALEAADEKIADYTAAIEALDDSNDAYIKENERLKKRIAELESQTKGEQK